MIDPHGNEATTGILERPSGHLASAINAALDAYQPISLAAMDGHSLLDRTDTKYILTTAEVLRLLESLSDAYHALDIDGRRLNRYRTVYFDTDDMAIYLSHHAGNEVRHKVRTREYVDSRLSFFEVKHKTNKDRTVKERLQMAEPATELTATLNDFLLSQFPMAQPHLAPRLNNEFSRATLVGKHRLERLTIDVDLVFTANGGEQALPGIAIVEVKQARVDRTSPVVMAMRAAGIPPRGISKYCLGVALLYPHIKHNNFKPKLLLLEKLMRGARHD